VPEANLVPVPAHVPLVHAAVVEPAAVSLHAVRKLSVPALGTALVVGAGPIGALAAQWLRILGWTRVLVADVDERKRQVMSRLGFETIDAARQDTVAAVKELTGGRGVDAAVEASGLPATLLQCLDATAAQGQVLLLGDLKGDLTVARSQISAFIRRELVLIGTWNSKVLPAGRSEWDTVVAAVADGSLEVEALISDTPDVREAGTVLADIAARRRWSNKVVFLVSPQARAELGGREEERAS
jgi:L-iditol 2-dehydrogenase/galactitol-1-phosphate 5-dehydrogenase